VFFLPPKTEDGEGVGIRGILRPDTHNVAQLIECREVDPDIAIWIRGQIRESARFSTDNNVINNLSKTITGVTLGGIYQAVLQAHSLTSDVVDSSISRVRQSISYIKIMDGVVGSVIGNIMSKKLEFTEHLQVICVVLHGSHIDRKREMVTIPAKERGKTLHIGGCLIIVNPETNSADLAIEPLSQVFAWHCDEKKDTYGNDTAISNLSCPSSSIVCC
jgi:hypothetical protein